MNKTLFLLRHAQSPSGSGVSDFDRPLSEVGAGDAAALGNYMCAHNYHPDRVLCSSALRTKETFEKICSSYDALDVEFSRSIYNAEKNDLLSLIRETSDQIEHLMIIGHNPAIYELAASLCGSGSDRLLQRLTQGFSPATLCVIETEKESWADIKTKDNKITDLVNPTDYNAPDRPTRWM